MLLTGLWLSVTAVCPAQQPSASRALDPSRRLDTTSQVTPDLSLKQDALLESNRLQDQATFAPNSTGDSDLGEQLIFKETPKQRPFTFQADVLLFWTDNAANTPAASLDDWFLGGQVAVGWQKRVVNRLFVDVDVSQQLYRYDRFGSLDFELLQASANLVYLVPSLGDLLIYLGPQFQRMTANDFGDSLFNSISLRTGMQKAFLINRRHSIQTAVMADWDLDTDLEQVFRHEYSADLGWQLKIMRDLTFALTYRFVWLGYTRVERNDALSLVGGNLSWRPRHWLELYATANWNHNNSDIDFFDYQSTIIGAGLGLRVRF
jgi:hypothetical protein